MTDMFDITSPCETPQSDVAYRKMTYRLKRLADDLIRANADINEAAGTVTYHPGWNDTKVAEAIGDEEWGDIAVHRRAEQVGNFRRSEIGRILPAAATPAPNTDQVVEVLDRLVGVVADLAARVERLEKAA